MAPVERQLVEVLPGLLLLSLGQADQNVGFPKEDATVVQPAIRNHQSLVGEIADGSQEFDARLGKRLVDRNAERANARGRLLRIVHDQEVRGPVTRTALNFPAT
jgi:hypothetical protein